MSVCLIITAAIISNYSDKERTVKISKVLMNILLFFYLCHCFIFGKVSLKHAK